MMAYGYKFFWRCFTDGNQGLRFGLVWLMGLYGFSARVYPKREAALGFGSLRGLRGSGCLCMAHVSLGSIFGKLRRGGDWNLGLAC